MTDELQKRAEREAQARFMQVMREADEAEWTGWKKGTPFPKELRHWTSSGVLRIVPEPHGYTMLAALRIGDHLLGSYLSPLQAAEGLRNGAHDDELPAPASTLNLPADPYEWSGLK